MPQTAIVIPAYNEGRNIGPLLRSLQLLAPKLESMKVILVNDGSTDNTLAEATPFLGQLDLEIVTHVVNQGVPKTFFDGFTTAVSKAADADSIFMIEGDGTSDLNLVPAMAKHVHEGADVVIASRCIPGGAYLNFPKHRTWGSEAINGSLRLLLRIPKVTDYTIFYRAYRAETLRKAMDHFGQDFITCRSFAANLEVLLKVQRYSSRFAEVPLRYDYGLKKSGSKMNVRKALKDYRHLVAARLAGSI